MTGEMCIMYKEKLLISRPNGLLLSRSDIILERNWRYDNCYKFIYSTKGRTDYQTKTQDISLHDQQYMILNPYDEHKQVAFEKEKFLVELDPFFLKEIKDSIYPNDPLDIQFIFQIQRHPQFSQWVTFTKDYLLLNQKEEIDSSNDIFLDHSLVQLALLLVKYGIGSHTYDFSVSYIKKASLQVFSVLQAMKEDYQHQWTLEEMAKVAHLGKYQFAHLFKEIVGISPYSWLQLYRIIRSQELLRRTQKSVLDIALECGFSSVSVFNQLFKRLYGITPGVFRQKNFR
jgi:AraC-like DNA-binding protein